MLHRDTFTGSSICSSTVTMIWPLVLSWNCTALGEHTFCDSCESNAQWLMRLVVLPQSIDISSVIYLWSEQTSSNSSLNTWSRAQLIGSSATCGVSVWTFTPWFSFRESYRCPRESCTVPIVDHIRRFVHDNGCLYLIMRKITGSDAGEPNSPDQQIVTWSWCKKCKKVWNHRHSLLCLEGSFTLTHLSLSLRKENIVNVLEI